MMSIMPLFGSAATPKLAARFKSQVTPTLKLLEYMTRHGIKPAETDD